MSQDHEMWFYDRPFNENDEPYNKGGITYLAVITEQGLEVSYAVCSFEDNFDKNIGKQIASNRFNIGEYITISNDTIGDYINSIEMNTFTKSCSEKIKASLTIHNLSLGAIKRIIINEIDNMGSKL